MRPVDALASHGPDLRLGPLERDPGFLLRLAQLRAYETFFAEFARDGLTPGVFSLLLVIEGNPGVRQGVLAEALRIKPANMAKTMRKLEQDGLTTRIVADDDRRAQEIRLTAKGAALLAAHAARFTAQAERAVAILKPAERRTLVALLRKLAGRDAP